MYIRTHVCLQARLALSAASRRVSTLHLYNTKAAQKNDNRQHDKVSGARFTYHDADANTQQPTST